jgi:hypothetical protein
VRVLCNLLCNLLCFWIVDFLGLAASEWFFSSQSFHFVNKYLVFLFLYLKIFLLHTNTHTWLLEVSIYFRLVSKLGILCSRFIFLECDLLLTSLFIMEKGELQRMCDKLFEQSENCKTSSISRLQ